MDRRKIAIIATACILAVSAIFVIPVIIDSAKSVTINIMVLPYNDAITTINGTSYKNGSYKLFPNENVIVTLKAEGFREENMTINIEKDSTISIQKILVPEDENDSFFLKDDVDIKLTKLFFNNDERGKEIIKNATKAEYIKDDLPIQKIYGNLSGPNASISGNNTTFITDATTNTQCKRTLCLQVSGTKKSEDDARKVLEEYGYNYDNYEVFYDKD